MKTVKNNFKTVVLKSVLPFAMYRSICRDSFFLWIISKKKTTLWLWNTEWIPTKPLFEKHIKSIRINPNVSKYWEFWELKVLVLDIEGNMTTKYGTSLFIIICHYKWKDWNSRRSIGC